MMLIICGTNHEHVAIACGCTIHIYKMLILKFKLFYIFVTPLCDIIRAHLPHPVYVCALHNLRWLKWNLLKNKSYQAFPITFQNTLERTLIWTINSKINKKVNFYRIIILHN